MCSIAVSTLVVEWIEILAGMTQQQVADVSTLVVEWIEIATHFAGCFLITSPPSWWSGLKSVVPQEQLAFINVSTLVVEWIEMTVMLLP